MGTHNFSSSDHSSSSRLGLQTRAGSSSRSGWGDDGQGGQGNIGRGSSSSSSRMQAHARTGHGGISPSYRDSDGHEGNIDSFIDDDDDEDGWHSADMVAGFSPTSPPHVIHPAAARNLPRNGEVVQVYSPNNNAAPDLLGGDLDWEAWETPRGPSPHSQSHDSNFHGNDLQTAFSAIRLGRGQGQRGHSMPRTTSPPIIDLRSTEQQLNERRQAQPDRPDSAVANAPVPGTLDATDLSFFEAFDNAPQHVMDTSRNASRDRRKLQGEQLDNMVEAQESPLDLSTPLYQKAIDTQGNPDYFGQDNDASASPMEMRSSHSPPKLHRGEEHRGSWTDAAGSWAGSFRRTLGTIRGHLPTAKDFYVDDDDEDNASDVEDANLQGTGAEAKLPGQNRKSSEDAGETLPQKHRHPRKLLHLQDYSQGTPFGSHTSADAHSPPVQRSSGLSGVSLGHHSSAPVPGAPAFDPNAGRNWNTGSWSLTSQEEIERSRKPIPVTLRGRRDETQDVIADDLAAKLTAYLPRRLQLGKSWKLLYSSDQDGISLGTLYHKVDVGLSNSGRTRNGLSPGGVTDAEGWLRGASESTRAAVTGIAKVGSGISIKEAGLVVAMRDANDRVFGAFVNERLRPQSSYYGSGECFLWKQTDSGTFKTYKWTGRNDYMILTEAHYLSFGGGDGRYGLWLDKRLEQGVSSPCPAFNNDILSDGSDRPTASSDKEGKFECIVLEVWACGID